MATLTSILKISTKAFKEGLQSSLRDAKSWAGKLRALLNHPGQAFKALGNAAKSAFRVASKMAVGAAGAMAALIVPANKFRQQMAEVRTLLGGIGDSDFAKLQNAVIGLSARFGVAKEELVGGLYQALSSGIPKDNALSFLEVAAQAAIGGVTTIESAVMQLTGVMSAYSISASEAMHVSDLTFTAVKKGKTTYTELAEALGDVAPIAAAAGVSIEELFASMATGTLISGNTKKTVTGLRAALAAIIKPSADLERALAEIGTTGEQLILDEGMFGAFDKVSALSGGSLTKLGRLVPSIEAFNFILTQVGNNAAVAADALNSMKHGANGATVEAGKIVGETRHWNRLIQSALAAWTQLGVAIDAKVSPHVDALSAKINAIRGSAKFDQWVDDVAMGLSKAIDNSVLLAKSLADPATRGQTVEALQAVATDLFAAGVQRAIRLLLAAAPLVGDAIGAAAKKAFTGLGDWASRKREALKVMHAQGQINAYQRFNPESLVGGINAEQRETMERYMSIFKRKALESEGRKLAASVVGPDLKASANAVLELIQRRRAMDQAAVLMEKASVSPYATPSGAGGWMEFLKSTGAVGWGQDMGPLLSEVQKLNATMAKQPALTAKELAAVTGRL